VTDAYGIPDLYFGAIPDEFYAAVGRITLLSTLTEQYLLELVWALDREHTQDHHAGKQGSELIKLARPRLQLHPEIEADGGALLDRVQVALNGRNAVVHSLWPNATMDSAWGWRPVRKAQREDDEMQDWIVSTEHDALSIRELILELVALANELGGLNRRVPRS
jgi:hypothetical protein